MAAGEAEEILTSGRSPEPFWGRAGSRRPSERELFRRTEQGTGGKSVFQIGGAGAVGTGSLRGMAVLHQLHEAGLAIWPFMAPGPAATVVEIYPRLLSGPVIKSNAEERRTYLRRFSEGQLNGHREAAAASEDAFDAAVSALVMWEHRDRLSRLCRGSDSAIRLEGAIWHPSSVDGSEAATGAA
jgi:hypothetical protein